MKSGSIIIKEDPITYNNNNNYNVYTIQTKEEQLQALEKDLKEFEKLNIKVGDKVNVQLSTNYKKIGTVTKINTSISESFKSEYQKQPYIVEVNTKTSTYNGYTSSYKIFEITPASDEDISSSEDEYNVHYDLY